MMRCGEAPDSSLIFYRMKIKFRWPTSSEGNDLLTYKREDVLLKLCEPKLIGSNKRFKYYELEQEDFCDASHILKLVLTYR